MTTQELSSIPQEDKLPAIARTFYALMRRLDSGLLTFTSPEGVTTQFKGVHEGELNGIAPTHRSIEFPFAISYEIKNEKIVHHWMIVDRMAMMEQLGVMNVPA